MYTGVRSLPVAEVDVAGVDEPDEEELLELVAVVVLLLLLVGELRREAVLRLARSAVRPTCTLPSNNRRTAHNTHHVENERMLKINMGLNNLKQHKLLGEL